MAVFVYELLDEADWRKLGDPVGYHGLMQVSGTDNSNYTIGAKKPAFHTYGSAIWSRDTHWNIGNTGTVEDIYYDVTS